MLNWAWRKPRKVLSKVLSTAVTVVLGTVGARLQEQKV